MSEVWSHGSAAQRHGRRGDAQRDRVGAAIRAGAAPQGLVAPVGELDGHVAEADGRMTEFERDIGALQGQSDVETLKAALEEELMEAAARC